MTDIGERLATEAKRLYLRYAVEIVEALSFCPYAQKARIEGRTREMVVVVDDPSDDVVVEQIELACDDPELEIGLLILPRLTMPRRELGQWVEVLRKRHRANHSSTILAIEGFHPIATADTTSAERLTPFVRRSPDPTLQLTRLSSLEEVRKGSSRGTGFVDLRSVDLAKLLLTKPKRPLHERIAEANLESVNRLGVEEINRRLLDILRDRDETYRAIDPTIHRWLD